MKIEIYIAAAGGVIQGIRGRTVGRDLDVPTEWAYYLCDYDDWECDGKLDGQTAEDFECVALGGHTWAEVEEFAVPVL